MRQIQVKMKTNTTKDNEIVSFLFRKKKGSRKKRKKIPFLVIIVKMVSLSCNEAFSLIRRPNDSLGDRNLSYN